jgi:G:T-mismatch repair DNA endonuclease (very short patch repair protein)
LVFTSEQMKQLWKNPEFREKMKNRIRWNKGLTKETCPKLREVAQKISETNKGHPVSEETRRKLSESHRGKPSPRRGKRGGTPWNKGLTAETCEKLAEIGRKISVANRGKPSWLKGKHLPTEVKEKISLAMKGRTPWNKGFKGITAKTEEAKQHMLEGLKRGWGWNKGRKCPELSGSNNPSWKPKVQKVCKQCGRVFYVKPSLEDTRNFCSRKCYEIWWEQNIFPDMIQALELKPNLKELKLSNLLEKCFPNEWKYCGDGQVMIGRLCPDFININGKKKVIELFGCYFHGCPIHYPKRRVALRLREDYRKKIYAQYGFECLTVWEHELEDETSLLNKISNFMGVV